MSDNRRAVAILPARPPHPLCLEKKVEAMTVLLLRQVRLFSNTLMINRHSYGTEYVAEIYIDLRRVSVILVMTLLLHVTLFWLMSGCLLVLMCQNICFVLISLQTTSVIMMRLRRTISLQAPVIE